ncbi:S1C family serine protease [Georgenia sp. H159]|uniref:S1C family serine protease n=1 Tax=Georgenia sp. H159 TaxID=3076115 RepID=UPI002D7A244A|nr:trypsin-like peptidase domain-containing protein [Georgenia sp. H159]
MSEHSTDGAARLARIERERREHEARVRAETAREAGGAREAAPVTAPEAHRPAVTAEQESRDQEPYRPAATERARREQEEVDALLLGGSAPGESPAATPGPAASPAAPDPATRVPFAGERPVLHQVPPRQTSPYQVPRERRRGWVAVGGAAATAALLASLGTATVTGAFESPALDPSTTAAPAQVVPASSTSTTPDWQAVTAAVRDSVVALDVVTGRGQGQGSGVIIDTDGTILTNSHVVAGAREVTVTLADGRLHEAELVGQDETTDLAVVRLVDPPADLTPATLGSSADLAVGQAVLAVGNPLGLDSTATTGIISALDRPVVTQSRTESVVTNAIQVDAAVNPGNSGGPLFDARGEVIGINSSIATLSGGQPAGSIGLGFAIPVDQAADVADQLVEDGRVEHAFLGVALSDATAEADGITRAGARIENVEPGSPAADAGLERGDVITAVDGRPVDSSAALTGYVRQYSAGEEAVLDVVRDGEVRELTAALATREVRA